MTPEIRRKLENNTTPFGLMEPELQEALEEARESDHKVMAYFPNNINSWVSHTDTTLLAMWTYRLAPSGLVIPDALWELLDKKWVAIAKDEDGAIFSYADKPKSDNGQWVGHTDGNNIEELFPNLDPYNCDWRNSLVMRPGYEES